MCTSPSSSTVSVIMLGRQQTVQSSVNVCRRPPLGSTNTSFSSPQNAQLYGTSLSLPDVARRFDCRSPLLSRDETAVSMSPPGMQPAHRRQSAHDGRGGPANPELGGWHTLA